MKINEGISTACNLHLDIVSLSSERRIKIDSRDNSNSDAHIVLARIEEHVSDKFIILLKYDYAKISPDLIFHRFLIFNFLPFATVVSSV